VSAGGRNLGSGCEACPAADPTFLPSRDSAMVRDVSVFSRMVGLLGLPMLAAISARALATSASWSLFTCSGSRFCGQEP
jgi:hypothetical protein